MARETFGGGAEVYGFLTAAMGAGAVVGGLVVAGSGRTGTRAVIIASFGFGIAILLAAAAPTLPLEIVAMTIVGAASVTFLAVGNSTLQLAARPDMRGRVMSLWAVAFLGTTPIGGPIAGYVSETAGGRAGLAARRRGVHPGRRDGAGHPLAAGALGARPAELATSTSASQTRAAATSPDVPDERREAHADCQAARMRSDAELLVAARADAGAFRELYERYAERIYGYHLRRSRDPDAAYDLTAETFAQAWLSRMRFRDEARGSAGPWLFGIARHVLLVSVRRRRLERSACERLGLLDASARDSLPEPGETWLDGVDEALAHLPDAQQQAIRLRVVEDLGYDEAAERLATTPQAVRARVSRGLSTLRKHLPNSTEMTP